MSVQTLLVPFASGRTNGENGGVKIDVPATSVDPGEVVPIYLWGASADALEGYNLAQGADSLSAGTVRQYPGQTEARLFDLDGSGGLKAFTWPVLRLLSVAAIGPCFVVDDNRVSLVALPGEDVTRHFRLSGNALAPAADSAVGGKLCGTVRATAARSPWCREWSWTVPDEPLAGLPDILCPATDEARDETLYWFFLLRWGVLTEDFSMSLSNVEVYEPIISKVFHFDAMDIVANDGDALETLTDKLGNPIELWTSTVRSTPQVYYSAGEAPAIVIDDQVSQIDGKKECIISDGNGFFADFPRVFDDMFTIFIVSSNEGIDTYGCKTVCLFQDQESDAFGVGSGLSCSVAFDQMLYMYVGNGDSLFSYSTSKTLKSNLSVATFQLRNKAGDRLIRTNINGGLSNKIVESQFPYQSGHEGFSANEFFIFTSVSIEKNSGIQLLRMQVKLHEIIICYGDMPEKSLKEIESGLIEKWRIKQ